MRTGVHAVTPLKMLRRVSAERHLVKNIQSNSRDRHSLRRSYPKENSHVDDRQEHGRSGATLLTKISSSSSCDSRTALGKGTNTSAAPRGVNGPAILLNDSQRVNENKKQSLITKEHLVNENKKQSLISKEKIWMNCVCAGVDFDSFCGR